MSLRNIWTAVGPLKVGTPKYSSLSTLIALCQYLLTVALLSAYVSLSVVPLLSVPIAHFQYLLLSFMPIAQLQVD